MPYGVGMPGSRRTWIVVGCVLVALLAGTALWLTNGGASPPGIHGGTGGSFHDIGANVAVGDGAPRGLHAITDNRAKPPFQKPVLPLGDVVHIAPGGTQPKPLMLRFTLNRGVTDVHEILIATSETGTDGSWTLVPATAVSRDGRYAYVSTTHLSWWQPIWRGITDVAGALKDELKRGIDALSGDATAEAGKPQCQEESAVRGQGYSIRSSGDSLYWCLGLAGGRPVLKIVNKRRYPLLVGHPGLTPTYVPHAAFGADRLAQKLTAHGSTTLFPFDENDVAVGLRDGQSVTLRAEYDGEAQSLYQLEFGVTTAVNMLTRFGAGEGVISNGAVTKSGFDELARYMGDFLKIKNCSDQLFTTGGASFGSIMSACFEPAEIMDVFGWKGLLIAPAMVAGPFVEFFRSEFNSIGDILHGRDRYTITVRYDKPDPLASYAGAWQVHGEHLVINADGTADLTFNAGPCLDAIDDPNTPMCNGRASVRLTPNSDGSLSGTYTKVWYETWSGSPPPAGFTPPADMHVGQRFVLSHRDAHTLIVTGDGPGNPVLCDAYAEAHNASTYRVCGA